MEAMSAFARNKNTGLENTHIMPEVQTIRYNAESGKGPKEDWLSTRKHSTVLGGVELPGLFHTSRFYLDAACFFSALAIEGIGLHALFSLGDVDLGGALGLAAVDIVGAWFAHRGIGALHLVRNKLVLCTDLPEQEALWASLAWWHKPLRALGYAGILATAVWKIISFVGLADQSAGMGLIVLIAISYAVVALLHIFCTGYFFAEAWTAFLFWRDRSSMLAAKPRENSPWHIKGYRRHAFHSPVELTPAKVEKHMLQLVKRNGAGGEYEILTWGILTDHEIQSLAEAQAGKAGTVEHQKAVIAIECLRHQLRDILGQDPVGKTEAIPAPAAAPATMHDPSDDELLPFDPAPPLVGSRNGNGASRTLGIIAAASLALSQGACLKAKKSAQAEFPLDIVVGSVSEAHLPEALVQAITPEKLFGGDSATRKPSPTIFRVDLEQQVSMPIKTTAPVGWVRGFWGKSAPLSEQVKALRDGVKSVALSEPFHRPADASDAANHRIAKFIADARKADADVIAVGGEKEVQFGTERVVGFADAAALSAEIARIQVATPGKRVTVLYGIGDGKKDDVPTPSASFRIAASDGWRDVLGRIAVDYCRITGKAAASTETASDGHSLTVKGTIAGQSVNIEILDSAAAGPFASLVADRADAGFSTRQITEQELALTRIGSGSAGVQVEFPVGKDAIAVVAHPSRTGAAISVAELRAAFTGRSGRVHAPAPGSEVALLFKQLVLGDSPFAAAVVRHTSERELISAVASEPSAIGFVSRRMLGSSTTPLRVAADGDSIALNPSPSTIARGYYPLVMPLYLYVPSHPAKADAAATARLDAARAFAVFASTHTAAHELLERDGFVSNRIAAAQPIEIDAVPQDKLPKFEAELRETYTRTIRGAEALSVAIRFEHNDATIDRENAAAIERLAAEIRQNPARREAEVLVVGFADSTGTPKASHDVSIKRAQKVADALALHGVHPAVVTGFGSLLPLRSNTTETGRAFNRRVEIWLRGPAATASTR